MICYVIKTIEKTDGLMMKNNGLIPDGGLYELIQELGLGIDMAMHNCPFIAYWRVAMLKLFHRHGTRT